MGRSSYKELVDRVFEMIEEDRWEEAFNELKHREKNGEKDAVAVLSLFYIYGVGIAQDVERGIEFLEKAIAMGSADAALELGSLYDDNEWGVPIDKEKAFEMYEIGARAGNEACYAAMSDCYLYGRGTAEDESKAFQYAMMAAKAGNNLGMFNAAICYDDGCGTNRDPYAAAHWYREVLKSNPDEDSVMLRLALCLSDPYEIYGIRPTVEMLNEAFYYAGKAVEKGNVEAHLIVGWFYEKGDVVPLDDDMAHKYIQIAADNGNEVAQEHIRVFRKNLYGKYYIPD